MKTFLNPSRNSTDMHHSAGPQAIVSDGLAKVSAGADVAETHQSVEALLIEAQRGDTSPVTDDEIADAGTDARGAKEAKKSQERKRKGIKPYVTRTEAIPLFEVGFAHLLKAFLALAVLIAMLGMIPIMGAATVAETEKIPLFADAKILAGLYAAMGMSGAIALAFLRTRFDLDYSRKCYDFVVIAVTVLAVLNFIIGLALSAFPPGADTIADGGLFGAVQESAGHWSYPAWALVLSGAVLEVCAGGLLSAIITDFIQPRRIVAVLPNPELTYLDEILIPMADIKCVEAETRYQVLKEKLAAFEKNQRLAVDHWLSLFDRLAAKILRARLEALESAQDELGGIRS